MPLDFEKCMSIPPIWKSDSKKEKLRKYVQTARAYLKQHDFENVYKTLTTIEELYNANN